MNTTKHLWEIDHPYYCHNNNFYHNGDFEEFDSWELFMTEFGDADFDLNLLFRWDWYPKGGRSESSDILSLFFILQRKGIFKPIEVKVKLEDEPKVIDYLKPRFEYLSSLWVPIVTGIKTIVIKEAQGRVAK